MSALVAGPRAVRRRLVLARRARARTCCTNTTFLLLSSLSIAHHLVNQHSGKGIRNFTGWLGRCQVLGFTYRRNQKFDVYCNEGMVWVFSKRGLNFPVGYGAYARQVV